MAGILDAWSQHALTTAAMRGKTGMGVVPNYNYSSGADFQANFPNLDPRVTAILASGYQLGQEGLRSLNPFGNTFLDFKGAYKTAAEQAAENIRGALELDQKVISPEQLALNEKYANSVLQGKSVYNTPGLASNESILNKIENLFFAPAYGDIPTKEEREGLESFNTSSSKVYSYGLTTCCIPVSPILGLKFSNLFVKIEPPVGIVGFNFSPNVS